MSPTGQPSASRDHGLVARLLGLRLAVDLAADLDVEEVDLAVDGGEPAVRVEDDARVRELLAALAALRDRAADDRDRVPAGPVRERAHRLAALERLGRLVQRLDAADRVPLLRQDDDVRAGRGGARDELLGALEVRGLVRRLDIWTQATRSRSDMVAG